MVIGENFPERSGGIILPLYMSMQIFCPVKFERQCAHADPPAPPARAAKASNARTNESPGAPLPPPPPATRRGRKTASSEQLPLTLRH